MSPARPAAARRIRGLVVATVVCALSALLPGCTPDDHDMISGAVDSIYEQAEGVTPEQRETREAHDVAVLDWAAELDLMEPRTAKQLMREYDAGAKGQQANQSGEKGFGVTDMTFWDFYTERILHAEELLKAEVRDSLSLDEVRAYYDQHLDQFEKQDVVTVEVQPWQDGRAREPYALTIDEDSVRVLQEQDDELIAAALGLGIGEETLVELDDGSYLQVTCTSRVDAGHASFDDVTQAALSQLTTERFDTEVQERIDNPENQ